MRVARIVVIVCTVAAVLVRSTPAIAFTEGLSNNFFGTGAGDDPGNTGGFNSFFGGEAGTHNTTGGQNGFFGYNAGFSNTTGEGNAFMGAFAGGVNTTGSNNAFFGRNAGVTNGTASNNAFFGSGAGHLNTGELNAFFGAFAGRDNTTGFNNALFGGFAGRFNTTGEGNAFFGTSAGFNNTIGADNTFVGAGTGFSNTQGSDNAFLGRDAGASNTTGIGNAFFGKDAGLSNTTEHDNTFLGAFSNGFAGISNATAVGHEAQVSQSNALVLGSIDGLNGATSDVNVGIGTTAPVESLHVRRADGTAKVLVQEASGTTLGRELFQLVNNGAARFRVSNSNNNATWDFQSSGGGGSFVIDRVGGPVSLDFEMQPDGDLVVRGTATATSFITSSDRNLKTDVTPADASKLVSLLRQLDISTWRFKNEPKGTVNLGPMAQDFHRLFGMGTETTIDVRDLAALALVAARAQQKEIDALKTAVAELTSRR